MNKILVTSFSASGTTREVGKKLAKVAKADFYEIKPKEPYVADDLNWQNKNSRSTLEMADLNSRPELASKDLNVKKYDIIFLGFPIWWYVAPTIINSFLESYDFSNKTIVLFATSGGSGFGKTIDNLKKSVSDTTKIIEGKLFNGKPTMEEMSSWYKSIKKNLYN